MSVLLTIRAHKRYAVCSKVRVRQDGKRGIDGLLIELSLDGCRISNVGKAGGFALGDPLTVRVEGTAPIEGRVRWANESTVGLRFDRPLHIAGLQDLIQLCRGGGDQGQRAYA